MIDRKTIKKEAKQMIRDYHYAPVVAAAIVLVISFVLGRLEDLVGHGNLFYSYAKAYAEIIGRLTDGVPYSDTYYDMMKQIPTTHMYNGNWGDFFGILVGLFTMILNGGFYLYCMEIRQRFNSSYETLLDGLGLAGKLIWCNILIAVRVFLWSLLFFIPGFVAAYRYRFAIYNILIDDRLSASDAIHLSCMQTRGLKGKLFALDLSFIGWILVSTLTFDILQIWLLPYMILSELAYFEEGQRRVGRIPYGGTIPPQEGDPWQTL